MEAAYFYVCSPFSLCCLLWAPFCHQAQLDANAKILCTRPTRLPKLSQLNETYDPNDTKNIVRLKDCFQFKNHLCLVFELLSINLYELLKQNQFRGLPLPLIRHFIKQILEVTGCILLRV